jgi:3-isopropylmalate/(R)-2-methylmalate dehydratase large subunit
VPASIKFVVEGEMSEWVSAKDLILHVIGEIGVDGALYQSMEFVGSTISALDMDGRMTVCNMAIEAGGKSGIIAFDGVTADYVGPRAQRQWEVHQSDSDAEYARTIEIDAAELVPTVSWPHLPSNTKPVADSRDVEIDQVVIGSCTNGRLEDMRVAAEILKGRKVDPRVRLIVIPATQQIWRESMHEGLFDIFVDAGAAVSTPTCGPCLGGHMGILAAGERAVATTNRNFVGRMGDPTSEVYLASPAVAAASAVAGHIAAPTDIE